MSECELREAICRVGASLYARRYVHASAGNISARLADGGMLITPTDACLGTLDPARLARLDAAGRQTGGERASKTSTLHAAIYQAARAFDADTACAIHTHATHCVALTLRGGAPAGDPAAPAEAPPELLPALTPYFVMKVGRVPCMRYRRPGDAAVAREVAASIEAYGRRGMPIRAVMLPRLGPVVWHATPALAMATLEELEETARLAWLAPQAAPLDETSIEALRAGFGARW